MGYVQGQDPGKLKGDVRVYDWNKNNCVRHTNREAGTMFLHCNQPKLYP